MRWRSIGLVLTLGAVFAVSFVALPVSAQTPVVPKPSATKLHWNLPMRTLGGKQFWTDHLIYQGWRIQQNVVTDHYRLLDPRNDRRAWGTWQQCYASWKTLKQTQSLPALKPRLVIFVHGLIRSRGSMDGIAHYVQQHGDYGTLCFSYASTRAEVRDHAKALRDVVSHLEGVKEIDFVAHSLGNIVIRHFLKDEMDAAADHRIDPRIKRIVMLAPPNNGAQLAERMKKNPAFKLVFGVSGEQLAEGWSRLADHLAIPPCEFGIIAGESDSWFGTNPLLEGKDDFVVRVAETRLPGARDFLVVSGLHSFIMDREVVRESTLRFLEHGYFRTAEKRTPIPAAANEAATTRTGNHD